MERIHAYKSSDGSIYKNSREWVEHEFFLLLCMCRINASKEEAAELVDRFKDFQKIYGEFQIDVEYGEGRNLGLVLDRRSLINLPKAGKSYIPPNGPEEEPEEEPAKKGACENGPQF